MNLKTLAALAVAAALAAPAMAQQSGSTMQPKDSNPAAPPKTFGPGGGERSATGATATGGFGGIDRNNDGYISRDEARDAEWNNRFSELDKDNDGRLSRSEYDAMHAASGSSAAPVAPVAPASGSTGANTSGTNAADRKPNTPKQ